MKIKSPNILLLFPIGLTLLLIASCGPALLTETQTATPTTSATFEIPSLPTCSYPCPEDSFTLTAAMGLTFAAIPSNTPPPGVTVVPAAGDLGWGPVYGLILDAVTGLPIEGATVKCEQFSYTSQHLCNGITTTDGDGAYAFKDVFFHDTDRITLLVEAPGYTPSTFEQAFFTQPELHTNRGLFRVTEGIVTPTLIIMCTYPACVDGVLVCAEPNGCMAGCGAICLPATPTP